MASKEEQEAGDLLARATGAYQGGDSRQALQLLDEGLALLPAGAATARALILLQKAEWLRESGYPEAAAKTLDDTVSELERMPRTGHETEWQGVRTEQGVVAHRRGDFKAAETFFAEAETLAKQSPLRDLYLPDVYANQASMYMDQGQLSKAQDVLLAALEIDQRVGNKRSESNDLNMLGLVHGSLGDTETSRVYLTKAFKVAYEAGLAREASDAMTNLASLMDNAGDHEGAAEIFRNVERMNADGGDESGVACSVANQGVAASQAGDLDRAVTLLTRSHELHAEVGNWPHCVQDLLNLSNTEARRGRYDQALSYAEQALAGAHEYGLIDLLWAVEDAVATWRTAVAAESADKEAAMAALEEALAGYRRAADVVELLRSKVDRPEERESLLAGKEGIYDKAISLCAALGRPRDAFQFCERARMRSFLDALGSSRVDQLEEDDPGTEQRAQLVARLLSPDTPPGDKPGLLDELRIMRAEKTARRPALAAITEAELPTEDDIRAAIPPGTCVLEYFQFGDSVWAFLLDQDGFKDSGVVTPPEPVEAIVSRFNDEIDGDSRELAAGRLLFHALLGPFMQQLAETEDLIIVPHRSLHYVPFSALWYEQGSDDKPSRRYLRTRFNLTTAPSASYLPYLARTSAPEREYGPAVVLGNPTGDLDGASLEARHVADRLDVTARLGADATREALLGAGAAAVVHVAGHGRYSEEDPLLSGLVLADGVVTVEDLLGSGPAPRLLVLSGCVTGKSERRPGDELIGLAQAALRSGTRSVVATLWETSDKSSTLFFDHFYDSLMEGGATVSQAITWARDALATGPGGYGQPLDWAPFLLIGDPQQRLVEPDQTPMAQFNRGVDLLDQGDEEGARNVFEHVASSGSSKAAGRAAFSLGLLLNSQGDTGGAQQAWQRAADSGDPEVAPVAMWGLGGLLEDQGDVEGARAAYQSAIDSGHPDAAPQAMISAGNLLRGQGDIEGARAVYQRALDSGHPEAVAKASTHLGTLLGEQGDIEGARAAYQRAIDGGDDENAPVAAVRLGTMLAQHGDFANARPALQTAIDGGHPGARAEAAYNLGVMLDEQEDVEGAIAAFQLAAQCGDADVARDANAWIADLERKEVS
jgi:CHAT domain-containing protein/Tfp pilus assembly protein PilF